VRVCARVGAWACVRVCVSVRELKRGV